MKTDSQISHEANLLPIQQIADKLDIPNSALYPYGHYKAKIDYDFANNLKTEKQSKLILVTAMSPTPAGEGKTTTTIGLGDALNRIGKKTIVCLREPSLGPCFGLKGGGTGGGYAQVVPMDEINLHFTGDFHAITSSHNLLSALIDNHIQWGNSLNIDPRKIVWKRVLDMNDRSLRNTTIGLGGKPHGTPRETGFDITVASEIMAIFCLATSYADLEKRLGNITIGYTYDDEPVYAKQINAIGSIMALLKDAFMPNIVQTLEHTPALVHGGPFANIAHGCNSVIATRLGLKMAEYVVTEAGFGADLGAEKFFDIKCRQSNLKPNAVVLVATIRALKMHGGIPLGELNQENTEAVKKGCSNLGRHIENLRRFKVPITVAINDFVSDTEAEVATLKDFCEQYKVKAFSCSHWANGGAGAEQLAQHAIELTEQDSDFSPLYSVEQPLLEKVHKIATTLYGAKDIDVSPQAANKIKAIEKQGFKNLPICVAKTQYSFSIDPKALGAPTDHIIQIRDVNLSSGAGFVVVICGAIMTMPGLPRVPSAEAIHLDDQRKIIGLF